MGSSWFVSSWSGPGWQLRCGFQTCLCLGSWAMTPWLICAQLGAKRGDADGSIALGVSTQPTGAAAWACSHTALRQFLSVMEKWLFLNSAWISLDIALMMSFSVIFRWLGFFLLFLLSKGWIAPITNGSWKNKCPNNVLLYDGDNYRSISDAAKGVLSGLCLHVASFVILCFEG